MTQKDTMDVDVDVDVEQMLVGSKVIVDDRMIGKVNIDGVWWVFLRFKARGNQPKYFMRPETVRRLIAELRRT